jgi:hypothetical protein
MIRLRRTGGLGGVSLAFSPSQEQETALGVCRGAVRLRRMPRAWS